ncbi:hypothetical protein [Halobacterium litoreum]|uniref:SPW repeat-containing protein n=1 Tax=Halobacterium litoreum TaxID=2039234 RepID=A0ABD5NGL4_9EURY|nr:hypothetical protein [Halobacterium litoreum]UHH12695.1 hypothetical protein LT972_11060 [Halobacterium litoreum]
MNRYDFGRWLGVAFVAIGVGALALTYPPSVALGAQLAALTAAGALFVLAGTPNPARDRYGPHRLLGLGDVLLGASIVASAVGTGPGDGGLFYLAVVGAGGVSLAAIGLGYIFRPDAFGLGPDGYPAE